VDLTTWVDPDTHGWVRVLDNDQAWAELLAAYGGDQRSSTPFRRTLEVLRESGCRSVVIENRYVDADYRSEFSNFWSRRFQGKPAFARRLHFFSTAVEEERLHDLPAEVGYLGYAVIRPVPLGSMGRTMVAPPARVARATLALVDDEVTLFGNRLGVRAAPFCQQDAEYLRCAHAAAWMCHYAAVRRGLVPRQLTAAFIDTSPAILSWERALPSKGMTLNQLQAVFGAFGQPALFYGLGLMPRVSGVDNPTPKTDDDGKPLAPGYWDTRLFSVICRYLNSGYPVLIGTEDHAFVVVGWYREDGLIRFIVNNDQRGPYGIVASPFDDERAPWRCIMVPLPPKVFLSAETAENEGHRRLTMWSSAPTAPAPWKELAAGVADKSISLRTLLRDGSEYKLALADRGIEAAGTRLLRLARLPHYVWSVEAHDRAAREAGNDSVIAEAVFDATSHDFEPRLAALLLPGVVVSYPPDHGTPTHQLVPIKLWRTGVP
jgi:hypothetical protein